MKITLIIGSSMAMPRNELSLQETWPYIISNQLKNHFFVNLCRRASTSKRFRKERQDILEYFKPNNVIIQIGITDCAPHYFSQYIILALSKFPKTIRDFIYGFKRKFSVRKKSNCYTSLDDFKKNYIEYIKRCQKCNVEKIIIILIAKPSATFEIKSPFIKEQVDKYNEFLISLENEFSNVHCIEPFDNNIDDYYIDDFHVNYEGQSILCEQIIKKISI